MTPQIPTIETHRLLLRATTPGDAAAIFDAYATDAEVARYLTWQPHKSVESVAGFLQVIAKRCSNGDNVVWGISLDGGQRIAGMIDARINDSKVEIGYVLAREFWGQGYMPEAINAVAEWFLADPAIHRVYAVCDIENTGSARALEKSGFEREGLLRKWLILPNVSAEPRDCFMYSRTG